MEPLIYAIVGPVVAVLVSLKSTQVITSKQDEKIAALEEKAKVLDERITELDTSAGVYLAQTMQPMAQAIKQCQVTLGIQ